MEPVFISLQGDFHTSHPSSKAACTVVHLGPASFRRRPSTLNGYLPTPPGSFPHGDAFCLDSGGVGAFSLEFRWPGADVVRPLVAHGRFHV